MKEGDQVAIFSRDGSLQVGNWTVPGELIDNYKSQEDIGWHIFLALNRGETEVIVRLAQPEEKPSGGEGEPDAS